MNKDTEKGNKHKGHRARMRDKFKKGGIDVFSDHEVIEFLLYYVNSRKDTNGIAHDLIDKFGSLGAVINASAEQLETVGGVSEATATFFSFLSKLSNRICAEDVEKTPTMYNTDYTGDYCCKQLANLTDERLIMLSLNAGRKLIACDVISTGNNSEVFFDTKKILELILVRKSNGVIFAHNHPGGSLHPSEKDITETLKIINLLESINVDVIDHIICFKDKFTSMSERGFLDM